VLPEVAPRAVDDEWLLLAELMLEHPGQSRVRALGHARHVRDSIALFGIKVDREVRRLLHFPVELVELDLVLAEILLGPRRSRDRRSQDQNQPCHMPHVPPPCWATATTAASPHRRSN